MSYSEGKISAPIAASDPYMVMGVGTYNGGYDIGYICSNQHGKINKWSLYKPVRKAKVAELTDADYYSVDFGYNIPSYNNYSSMKAGVTNGWSYLPPQGGDSSPFRLTDFNGYNHRATAPFALTLTNGNPNYGDVCRISVPTEITWLTNWNTWNDYQGTSIQYLNCGFYVPGVGYYPLTDKDQGLSITDLDIEKLNFEITKGYFTVGSTYKVYLVLTSWDGLNGGRQWYNPADNEGGIWWVLATDQPLQFTVLKALTPFDSIIFTGSGTATVQYQNGYYAWRNVNLNMNVRVLDDYNWANGTLGISVVITQHYPGTGSSTENKIIAEASVANIAAGLNQAINRAASDFNLLTSKEDSVNARVDLTLTIGAERYTSTANLMITSY